MQILPAGAFSAPIPPARLHDVGTRALPLHGPNACLCAVVVDFAFPSGVPLGGSFDTPFRRMRQGAMYFPLGDAPLNGADGGSKGGKADALRSSPMRVSSPPEGRTMCVCANSHPCGNTHPV